MLFVKTADTHISYPDLMLLKCENHQAESILHIPKICSFFSNQNTKWMHISQTSLFWGHCLTITWRLFLLCSRSLEDVISSFNFLPSGLWFPEL